jgi:hypothetical protein
MMPKAKSKRARLLISAATAALSCIAAGALAQTAPSFTPKEGTVYNRPVYLISNDKLEAAIVKQGGSMLRVLIQGDAGGISPFGNPEMVPNVPDNRKLQGAMVGHFVCVDGFGSPSAEERKAGAQMHGEAYLQPWKLVSSEKQGGTTTVKFTANLPMLQENFSRTFQMVDGENVIYVESELESLLAFDRPANWGEHPFLYPPFIEAENTVVDMSGTRAQTRGDGPTARAPRAGQIGFVPGKEFTWPMAPTTDGKQLDVRFAPAGQGFMAHTTTLMDPARKLAFATILNKKRNYLLGYVFRREEFPWVQNYMAYTQQDWMGRGIEFATQPYDLPRRQITDMNKMFDTPVYRWLPAKSKIGTRFLMFYVKSPEGMTKIDDVRLENGKLIIEDKAAGKTLTLNASLPM